MRSSLAAFFPLPACDRRCRYRSHTSGSPLLVRPAARCIGPGTNDTGHPCGALSVRIGKGPLARSPLLVRRAISRNPPHERPAVSTPTGVLLLSGPCTPVLPYLRPEDFRSPQSRCYLGLLRPALFAVPF